MPLEIALHVEALRKYAEECRLLMTWVDVLDIAFIGALLSIALVWLRGRTARAILFALVPLMTTFAAAKALKMFLTSVIFQFGMMALLVSIVVIFQDDFRRAFEGLAAWRRTRADNGPKMIGLLAEAVKALADSKTGALAHANIFPMLRGSLALFLCFICLIQSGSAVGDWEYVDLNGQRHTVSDDFSSADIESHYQRTVEALSPAEMSELKQMRRLLADLHFHQAMLERPGFFRLPPEAQRPIRQELWREASYLEKGGARSKKLRSMEAEVAESVRRIDEMERDRRNLSSELNDGREIAPGYAQRLNPAEAQLARDRIRQVEEGLKELGQKLVAQRAVLENLKAAPQALRTVHEQIGRVRADAAQLCHSGYDQLVRGN